MTIQKNEKSDSIEIIGELYTINTHKNECSLEIASEDEKNGINIRFSFDKEFKDVCLLQKDAIKLWLNPSLEH